jgi:glutamyl-tRNA reductase
MSVLLVGLSHRTASVDVLEQVSMNRDDARKLLTDLVASEQATESLVLSTCNRVEVYVDVDKFHSGVAAASDLLARHAGVRLDALTPHLYVHYEDRAVAHLFAVACGLESMVVGESQILGQVRVALRDAQEMRTAGRLLNELAQQALRVGKRARTETGIDRAGRSLVTAGLDQVEAVLGPLAGRPLLIVGAGSMSALTATVAAQRAMGPVVVANRTVEHASRVAAGVGGEAVGLDELPAAMVRCDVMVSCTGSVGHIVSAADVREVQDRRGHRPLVLVDLALPRDVESEARTIDGVSVVDLETLAPVLIENEHASDVEATRGIVADEVAAFLGWQRAASVAPTVVALRGMAEAVVRSELARLSGRLPALDAKTQAEIELTVRRVVDKVLHAPTVRVKQLAEEPGGQSYADALTKLFGLDPKAIEAMTRADVDEAGS